MRHGAGIGPVGAEDHAHQLAPPGADQAGEAEDLAAMERRRLDAVDLRRRAARHRRAEHGARRRASARGRRLPVARRRRSPRSGRAGQVLAADHARDRRAVAEDGDPVAEVEDLVEPVRDIEHRDAGARRSRTIAKSRSDSWTDSDAVGSSMTISRLLRTSARQIETSQRSAVESGRNLRVEGEGDADAARDRLDVADGAAPVDRAEAGALRLRRA